MKRLCPSENKQTNETIDRNYWPSVPLDVLKMIFEYLGFLSQIAFRKVCKKFYTLHIKYIPLRAIEYNEQYVREFLPHRQLINNILKSFPYLVMLDAR